MLDMNEIYEEIANLEQCHTSYDVCKKLAILYIVRDHYRQPVEVENKNETINDRSMMGSMSKMM